MKSTGKRAGNGLIVTAKDIEELELRRQAREKAQRLTQAKALLEKLEAELAQSKPDGPKEKQ